MATFEVVDVDTAALRINKADQNSNQFMPAKVRIAKADKKTKTSWVRIALSPLMKRYLTRLSWSEFKLVASAFEVLSASSWL
jgi:hypothetical protein